MPERPTNKFSERRKEPDKREPGKTEPNAELGAILEAARKALGRGDGWTIEPKLYDRLRRDLEAIGHPCDDPAVTRALRACLAEITPAILQRRADKSYSGLADDQTLYQSRW